VTGRNSIHPAKKLGPFFSRARKPHFPNQVVNFSSRQNNAKFVPFPQTAAASRSSHISNIRGDTTTTLSPILFAPPLLGLDKALPNHREKVSTNCRVRSIVAAIFWLTPISRGTMCPSGCS
jgi:hypothetical protein